MTHRERVLTALNREEPDRVPYMELGVDRNLALGLLGRSIESRESFDLEANSFSIDESKEVAELLKQDNVSFVLRAPVYANRVQGKDGRLFYGDGMIKTPGDLSILELPDPTDDSMYVEAEKFVAGKGDFAACFLTRAGIFPTILSMGIDNFSIALYEDRGLLEEILERYFTWSIAVAERACAIGFDIFITTDDMAFKTAPYFSPEMFEEVVLPWYKELAQKVTLPWIAHSDGNIRPFLDYLFGVGISGIHPNEKGAVDIVDIKKEFGDRACVLGNVDLNILGAGTPDDVREEVRTLIRDVAPGGGYIVTSGNSLTGYCLPDNVLALGEAVQQFGAYPISI